MTLLLLAQNWDGESVLRTAGAAMLWLGAALVASCWQLLAKMPPPTHTITGVAKAHFPGCRLVRLTVERPCWVPEAHSSFLKSFKLAVRSLMLAAHRANSGAQNTMGDTNSGARLSDMPPELLHEIIGAAAWPLSAWVDFPY